jgi:hypothetical protein
MTVQLATNCPHCLAAVEGGERTCARCGTEIDEAPSWSSAPKVPLILPGNPALSADVAPGGGSLRRILIGSVAGATIVLVTLAVIHREGTSTEMAPQVVASAVTAPADSVVVDSASASSYADLMAHDSARGVPIATGAPMTSSATSATLPLPANAGLEVPLSAKPALAAPVTTGSSRSAGTIAAAVAVDSLPVLPATAARTGSVTAPTPTPGGLVAETQRTSVAPQPVRDLPPPELPDATEIRAAVNRVAAGMRSGVYSSSDIRQFFTDGADYRIAPVQAPSSVADADGRVRVRVELRLTKFDAGGRPVTRIVPVSMDLNKTEGAISTSNVTLGAVRRP